MVKWTEYVDRGALLAESHRKTWVLPRLLDPSNRRYRRGREEDRAGRSSLGRASLTFSGRPPNALPSKLLMAARPSASLPIVTNAKPPGWPVSLSVTTLISVTLPNGSKNMLKVSLSDGE